MTSLSESFSLVALEAMACGVPVVSTDVGGLPEVVLHGQTGGLFPQGDQQSAVRLALDILLDPAQHRQMREAAIRHAQRFSWERIIPRYEALYRELLYRRPASYISKLQRQKAGPLAEISYPQHV
jgi:glycosyltransferase involved in cell wall biosynthesis